MIKMDKVQSSNVVAIGHDGKNVMRVEYRGDSFYDFQGVSADDFDKLQKAKSVGSHLHRMGINGTKIITSKCPECGKIAMIKVDAGGEPMDVDHWQCQSCGHLDSF